MVQFTKPLYLILILPLVYYTYRLSKMSLADMSVFRRRLSLGLRIAMLVMLVLALSGMRIVRGVSQKCVVFAIDVSDSIPKSKQDAALGYINHALAAMRNDERAAVVAFGGDSSVELSPGNVKKVERIYSVPNRNQTDIAQALGLALAIFPEESAKKIVLLTDGNETRGQAVEQAMLAASESVSVDVVPISDELTHEALLDKMLCPNTVKVGEPFDLKLVAVSKEPATGQIRILRNGTPVASKDVQMVKGKSVFTFQQSLDKAGNYEFKAILDCAADTRAENNVALGYTMVKGKPRVLYVEGSAGQSKYLASVLNRSDIEVDVRDKAGIPVTLPQLRGYDMVVFSDLPAWNLSAEQMSMIQSGVKDLGIGFTMIGGENSFGAGGYFDTPIEEALPVDMSIRKTKVLPSLSVVVVMDKSGSMGAQEGGMTKIQLANDAAASVVKLLQPIDKVGVIVCHDYPVAAVNLQPASNKGGIYEQISTIQAEGGGIAVFPSMKMANEMISGANTRQRHIILLADGADCDDQDGVVPLVQRMAAKKITVTAVAIGDGPHVPFLKAVAGTGKGGFYLAQQAADLKAIFTKDVMTISKSLVIEEPFIPEMDPSSPELKGIEPGSVPPLLGYVATSSKPAANLAMRSHRKDPILATWQYGLGRSAAFTSDCKPRWSARWIPWAGYEKVWTQILRSTMRKSAPTDFQTTVDVIGGRGSVAIDAVDEKGNFLNLLKFGGTVVTPSMKTRPLVVEQTGPGRYESNFDADEVGNYLVNIGRKDRSNSSPEVSVVTIPYPPEYKDIAPNTALLERLASDTSGRFNPKASEVFSGKFLASKAHRDLWHLLVLLSLCILPLDIAVRRLAVGQEQVVDLLSSVWVYAKGHRPKLKMPHRKTVEAEENVDVLLQSRRERKQSELSSEQKEKLLTGIGVSKPGSETETKRAEPKTVAPKPETTSGQEATISQLLEAKRRSKEKNE